jgi:Asp-tRNAAsn/Glu-tRNAGln amidotransferase A subunit and related amidases
MQYADYLIASLSDLQQALQSGAVTSRQLTEFALQRIAEVDQPRYNAITWLFAEEALAAADASGAQRQRGGASGQLTGIPVLIKDNIEVKGWPTSAGSVLLRDVIAREDAPLITTLRQQGAILIGKTAMHELAAGITGASSLSGFTHNAWREGRSPADRAVVRRWPWLLVMCRWRSAVIRQVRYVSPLRLMACLVCV